MAQSRRKNSVKSAGDPKSEATAAPGGKDDGFPYDIVALAASVDGLSALSAALASLPEHFPATIVIVQHLDPRHRSLMAEILSRRSILQVQVAKDGCRQGLHRSPRPAYADEPG